MGVLHMMAENFNHIFFTELLGMPVYDLKHRRIGRVKDAAVVPLIHSSRIDRFLVSAGGSWLSIRYDQIAAIAFTGEDTATGKSWETWIAKKDSERRAEVERVAAEAKTRGIL